MSNTWFPHPTKGPAIDLCCGAGGSSLGAQAAGFHVAHAYDIWQTAIDVYNHYSTTHKATQCDLLSHDGFHTVTRDCRALGGVSLLISGPPCQGFSQIRNGHHYDDVSLKHTVLIFALIDYIAAIKPSLVVIENVPHLTKHNNGYTLRRLLELLQSPGPRALHYHTQYQIYDTALFGVPQARKRLIIVGTRSDITPRPLPPPTPNLTKLYAALRRNLPIPAELTTYADLLNDPHNTTMTAPHHALSDLPIVAPAQPELPRPYDSPPLSAFQQLMRTPNYSIAHNTQTPRVRPSTIERVQHIPPGGNIKDLPPHLTQQLQRRFYSAYRRLHPIAPATTLSTRYDCLFHYALPRTLSIREYARLQSLPDFITFPPHLTSRHDAYTMIGNAAPPLFIKAVLNYLTNS